MNDDTPVARADLPPLPDIFLRWMQDLGDILWLASRSRVQGRYPLAILRSRVFASLWHGQYRLLRQDGQPVAFLNWAWLSEELSRAYQRAPFHLEPEQWRSGDQLWFMEIMGPSHHLPALIRDLREHIPSGTHARWHEVDQVDEEAGADRAAATLPRLREVRVGPPVRGSADPSND